MFIPKRLDELMSGNQRVYGHTMQVCVKFEQWISNKRMVFFPEFTDHGIDHVVGILHAADRIISNSTWEKKVLTPFDGSTFVLATLLHDCAMHLTKDGFISLIQPDSPWVPLRKFKEDIPWHILWDEFLREARRFDDKTIIRIYGTKVKIKDPNIESPVFDDNDYSLIGEFLRRHHHRLAHEISKFGIPGSTAPVDILMGLEDEYRDIAGLVARSHGIALRASVDRLGLKRNQTYQVHVPFLMAVLRVSDYLQIQSDRAPQLTSQLIRLRSPISVTEWKKHQAVRNIHFEDSDPEAIVIEGIPNEIDTYLSLKCLLEDIQRELDLAWAVLGEIYGSHETLKCLGLSIRRIKHDLENQEVLAEKDFIPIKALFKANDAELLKLLVGPLYEDRPEYGIRELLQNAVDACRELDDFLFMHPRPSHFSQLDQEPDVLIAVEEHDGYSALVISDKGIGMTPSTVVDYFLTIGASFRKSEAWKVEHTDCYGNSRVLRSGRFGIGVLAAFLLGERIEVSSRYITEETGLSFKCSLEDDLISINKRKFPVGTRIEIRLSDEALRSLSSTFSGGGWDWYCLSHPTMKIVDSIQRMDMRQSRHYPAYLSPTLQKGWMRLKQQSFADFHWSWEDGCDACNGIAVESIARNREDERRRMHFLNLTEYKQIPRPTMSIFDNNNSATINLQRTEIVGLPEETMHALTYDVSRSFIAHLTRTLSANEHENNIADLLSKLGDFPPGPTNYKIGADFFLISAGGIGLATEWHIRTGKVDRIVCADPKYLDLLNLADFPSSAFCSTDGGSKLGIDCSGFVSFYPRSSKENRFNRFHRLLESMEIDEKDLSRRIHNEWLIRFWGDVQTNDPLIRHIGYDVQPLENEHLLILYFPTIRLGQEVNAMSPIETAWKDLLESPFVPFAAHEPSSQLAKAKTALATYEEMLK